MGDDCRAPRPRGRFCYEYCLGLVMKARVAEVAFRLCWSGCASLFFAVLLCCLACVIVRIDLLFDVGTCAFG